MTWNATRDARQTRGEDLVWRVSQVTVGLPMLLMLLPAKWISRFKAIWLPRTAGSSETSEVESNSDQGAEQRATRRDKTCEALVAFVVLIVGSEWLRNCVHKIERIFLDPPSTTSAISVDDFGSFMQFAAAIGMVTIGGRHYLRVLRSTHKRNVRQYADLVLRHGGSIVKWILTVAAAGLLVASYQRWTEAAKAAEQMRTDNAKHDSERTQKLVQEIYAFRSALVAFGSNCIPRLRLGTKRLDEIEQCSNTYQNIQSGYAALTWDVPLFAEDIVDTSQRDASAQGAAADVDLKSGDQQYPVMQALRCAHEMLERHPEDDGLSNPMSTASISYRHFVTEYGRALSGSLNMPCLERAYEDLFIETRMFGCALVTVAHHKVSQNLHPDGGQAKPLSFCLRQLAYVSLKKGGCSGTGLNDPLKEPWLEYDRIHWDEMFGVADAGVDGGAAGALEWRKHCRWYTALDGATE